MAAVLGVVVMTTPEQAQAASDQSWRSGFDAHLRRCVEEFIREPNTGRRKALKKAARMLQCQVEARRP